MLILKIALAVVSIWLIMSMIHFFVTAVRWPHEFLERYYGFDRGWKRRFYFGSVVLGSGVILYCGYEALFWWVPSDLGGIDEEGDFHPLKGTLSAMLTIFSLQIIKLAESNAKNAVQLELARAEIRKIEQDASRGAS